MTALAHLKANPEIKHCEIRVGFGPDEEIELAQINLMLMILMSILPTLLTVVHWVNCSMKPSLPRVQS